MSVLVGILRFVTIFCGGMGMVSLWTVLTVVVPLIRGMEQIDGGATHGRVDPLLDRGNFIMIILSVLAGVLILILHHNLSPASGAFTAIGVVGVLCVAPLSLGLMAPISRQLRQEPASASTRRNARRWEALHVLRTISGLIGFAAYSIAAVV